MNPKPNTDRTLIDRIINRGVEDVIPTKAALEKLLLPGRRLNIYQGFDPTAPTLHIGHTVGMRKLRDFQKLGHNVIFLIGDFTARIGDPDKLSQRKMLTKADVDHNFQNYKEQASKILDFNDKSSPIQTRYNSEWQEKLKFNDIIQIASKFSVQQMIKREMFQKRMAEDRPIYIHEFMYPIMQAYDALVMDTDIEVGGNDQVFNMLAGRDLIMKVSKKEKIVLACKLLTDPAGEKMGKTTGNMIMLSDTPNDIYGKVMAMPDSLIALGFELLTDVPDTEISTMQKEMKSQKLNPMDAKKKLAYAITSEHKGEEEAKQAQNYFENNFQKKSPGTSDLSSIKIKETQRRLMDLIVLDAKFAESNAQAKRLIEQGGVYVNDKKVTDKNAILDITKNKQKLRVGRRLVQFSA